MDETHGFGSFMKERLESGLAGEPPRMEGILRLAEETARRRMSVRRRMRILGGFLAAASIAAMCMFAAFLRSEESPSSECTVADVIDILRVTNGLETIPEDESAAEKLIAWQDAPYESAISGLLASN